MSHRGEDLPPELQQAVDDAVDRMHASYLHRLRQLADECESAAGLVREQDEALGNSLDFCAHRLRAMCDRAESVE